MHRCAPLRTVMQDFIMQKIPADITLFSIYSNANEQALGYCHHNRNHGRL